MPWSAFSESLCNCKGVKSLGKEGSARGEDPLFKAVFLSRKKDSMSSTSGVLPQDRDKDRALAPRKMPVHFPLFVFLSQKTGYGTQEETFTVSPGPADGESDPGGNPEIPV